MSVEIVSERGGDSTVTHMSDQKLVFILLSIGFTWLVSLFVVAYDRASGKTHHL